MFYDVNKSYEILIALKRELIKIIVNKFDNYNILFNNRKTDKVIHLILTILIN